MAKEAVIRDRLENPIDFTVGDSAGIEKGAVLRLFDPRIASGALVAGCACAGIAAREKIAGDGRTQLAVFRRGIFDMYASGAIVVGEPVCVQVDNHVIRAVGGLSGASIIGHALETAAAGQVVQIYLNVGAGSSSA